MCKRSPWVTSVIALVVAGCPKPNENSFTAPADARSEAVLTPSVQDDGPPWATDRPGLVGVWRLNHAVSMTNPGRYCLEDDRLYLGAPARVGDLNVFTRQSANDFAGQLVLVRGNQEGSLLSALVEQGPCPKLDVDPEHIQMRSDWVAREGGYRTTKAKLRELPFFRATRVVALDLGSKRDERGDRVQFAIKNPFTVSMNGLEAVAHYEGGPGKPMPRFEPITLVLPPGATQIVDLAARVEAGPAGADSGEPRGVYVLATVDLRGKLGALTIDVSLPAQVKKSLKN